MTKYDFKFDGHRPNDFGCNVHVKSHNIGFPEKTKVTAIIPFSNTVYDFSKAYGSQTYGERTISYVVNVAANVGTDVEQVHEVKRQLINWLMKPIGKVPLFDDKVPDYYFLGEVQANNSFEDSVQLGGLTVTFTCYPFMIKIKPEGDDVWDTFNFEHDIAQMTSFVVNGVTTTTLINDGINAVQPNITSDADMTVTLAGAAYKISKGTSTNLLLPIGVNTVVVEGAGTISFEWHEEVI